jgi:glycosyltransferase involved in cell wall biosynthesis
MRLTFVASSLGCGGVERVTVRLSGGLAARGHDVTVVTLADERADFFHLSPKVQRHALGIAKRPPTPFWRLAPAVSRRLAAIARAVEATAPDVVISRAVQVNVPVLMALRGRGFPTVVTEHGDRALRADADGAFPWRKWLWYRLRRLCYPSAFRLVSVSQAIDQHFSWLPSERRAVIYNPFPEVAGVGTHAGPDRPRLVAVGRLSHDKGFDVLIRAFARIARRFAAWQLQILGDGELREELQQLSEELGLGDQVLFAGAVADPSAVLRRAQIFVMASRYEGFPNALGEALSCGLPAIATDCPSRPGRVRRPGGVRELVRDGIDGCLVPPDDPVRLAQALARLMADPHRRRRLASRTREVTERFSLERILDEWESLFYSVKYPSTALQRARGGGG